VERNYRKKGLTEEGRRSKMEETQAMKQTEGKKVKKKIEKKEG
jgi:hypothetical protein